MAGFQNAAVAVGIAGGGPDNFTGPDGGASGLSFATMKRTSAVATATVPASGVLQLAAIYLPAGVPISRLGWVCGGTGATAPTSQWLALFDLLRNMLANTADQGAAAITANTVQGPYPIATVGGVAAGQLFTAYSGLYYVGLDQVATTPGQPWGNAGGAASAALNGVAPVASGTSNGGLTTGPPAYPFQANAPVALQGTPFFWAS